MEFPPGELPILRDDLAVHRTTLANERTMLAYLRTALTFFVAGITFIKFFETPLIIGIGWAMVPASVIVLLKGAASYRKMSREIVKDEQKSLYKTPGG